MTKKKKTLAIALATVGISCLIPGIALTAKNYDCVDGYAVAETKSASAWDIAVASDGNRVAFGPGWGEEAAQKVGNAIKAKWEELGNAGEPTERIKPYKADSTGDAVVLGLKVNDSCYLLYNVLNDEVYTIEGVFAQKIGELRRIGAPVTDKISNVTVTGYDGEGNAVNATNATVQVFETGVVIDDGGTAIKHEGVIEKISDTEYKIYPLINDQDILANGKGNKITVDGKSLGFIGDVDGTWHALRTARTFRENGKLTVEFNFRAGCIKVVYNDDWTINSRMAYAGQNFAYDGGSSERVMVPVENFTTDEHLWENPGVDSSALSMYRTLSGNSSATADEVKNVFRTAYLNLIDDGIIPGYRCSWIKVWDVVCVDYKYSPDSMYGFDGVGSAGRERMFTLVYSGVQKNVYGVGNDIWNLWRDDSVRRALGAPISNELEDVTISGMNFSRIQIFEQGYIYENSKGALVIEYGATTDNEYKNFEYTAEPTDKPSQYGGEVERFTTTENNRKVVYINYQRGAVKATETFAKLGYLYDYYPGRNFEKSDNKYTAKMLAYEQLYSESDFTCEPVYNDIFEGGFNGEGDYVKGVKEQLIEKIKSLLNSGFFPGFLESNFQAWNLVACQQFIYGDSTALPWGGDARTNVCALIYNVIEGKIFLLKDAFMELWGGTQAYTQLGAPAGEEFKVEGNQNLTFQYFYGTATQNNKAFAVSVGYNEATFYAPNNYMVDEINPVKYIEGIKDLTRPLAGITILDVETDVKAGGFAYIEYEIDGAAADAKITLTSSNDRIAEVMADGSVEFKKAGTVTITVTVTDGVNTFTDKVTFNVKK